MSRTFKDIPHKVAVEKLRRKGKAEDRFPAVRSVRVEEDDYEICVPSSDVEHLIIVENYLSKLSEDGFENKMYEYKIRFKKKEIVGYPQLNHLEHFTAVFGRPPFHDLVDEIKDAQRPFWMIEKVSKQQHGVNVFKPSLRTVYPSEDLFTVFEVKVTMRTKDYLYVKTEFDHKEAVKYGLVDKKKYWEDLDLENLRYKKSERLLEGEELEPEIPEDFDNEEMKESELSPVLPESEPELVWTSETPDREGESSTV